MINFVVVEDNEMHKRKINNIITKKMMKNDIDFQILNFSDLTIDLESVIKDKENNHIYILDFELPSVTAIDIARKIRKNDWKSPIIISSVHGGMAYESFKQRLEILDFVNKQFEYEKNLNELIDLSINKLNCIQCLNIKIASVLYTLDYERILYLAKDPAGRKTIIKTDNNEYSLYITLSELIKNLDNRFKYTHRACIANTKRVEKYNWVKKEFVLDTGEIVPLLSVTHKKELKNND